MRTSWIGILIAPLALLGAGPVAARGEASADAAIAKGVRYLEKTVFGLPDAAGTPRKQFTIAVTGLVDLLARDGTTSPRRRKGTAEKARTYLERYVSEVREKTRDPSMLAETSASSAGAALIQYTWPLAMSALFFGELHARGMGTQDAAATLRTIVDVLAEAQAPNGGWGHARVRGRGRPRGPSEMDGLGAYPDTLLASSNLVTTSLCLVRPIAPPTNLDLEERALAYYEYAELANGNFPYDPSQRAAQMDMTGVSRAAGAALAMHLLGVEWSEIGMSRALEIVDEHFEYLAEGHGSSTLNLMLAAFLQHRRGPRAWARFKETFFPRILEEQQKDGSFLCVCRNKAFGATNDSRPFGGRARSESAYFANSSDAYVSAMHTLILLLDRAPMRLLPAPTTAEDPAPTTPR